MNFLLTVLPVCFSNGDVITDEYTVNKYTQDFIAAFGQNYSKKSILFRMINIWLWE
jgi:hypothetical protein